MTRSYLISGDARAMNDYAQFLLRKVKDAPTSEREKAREFVIEMIGQTRDLLNQIEGKLNE